MYVFFLNNKIRKQKFGLYFCPYPDKYADTQIHYQMAKYQQN